MVFILFDFRSSVLGMFKGDTFTTPSFSEMPEMSDKILDVIGKSGFMIVSYDSIKVNEL